jgi:hypothetical protein
MVLGDDDLFFFSCEVSNVTRPFLRNDVWASSWCWAAPDPIESRLESPGAEWLRE